VGELMASRFRLGVDLGGTKTEIAALDDEGLIVYRERVASPRGDYSATVETIRDLVLSAEIELGAKGTVGVAIPGAISPATGLVKNANSTWLNGKPFDRDLEQVLERPVRLANDANCFALSEAVDGAATDGRVVFGVIAGTGIGGGIVVERKLLTGPHAIAGEWGHNPLPWPTSDELPGPSCYCGKRGCNETWLSGPALSRIYAEMTREVLEPPQIVARATAGEKMAVALIESWLDRFARALASVVNILDPDVIVLGGGLSNVAALERDLNQRLAPFVFSDRADPTIRKAMHGDSSGVRGAAWLWE
jgi:fructokinase